MSKIHTKTVRNQNHIKGQCRNHKAGAFTLIELLTAIAIIAIVAGIVLAALGPAKEAGRKATTLSSLHDISVGIGEYQRDHQGNMPPVLFAFADGTQNMNGISTDQNAAVGLYPVYVKDYKDFLDPDDSDYDGTEPPSASTITALNHNVSTLGVLSTPSPPFPENPPANNAPTGYFNADAYDVSPQITGNNQLGTQLVVRYQPQWTSNISPAPTAQTYGTSPIAGDGITYSQFQRQLAFPDSVGDTYVTCSTYHLPASGKVLVLFKAGNTVTMDVSQFLASENGTDATDISVDGNGVSKARFWTVTPNGTNQ